MIIRYKKPLKGVQFFKSFILQANGKMYTAMRRHLLGDALLPGDVVYRDRGEPHITHGYAGDSTGIHFCTSEHGARHWVHSSIRIRRGTVYGLAWRRACRLAPGHRAAMGSEIHSRGNEVIKQAELVGGGYDGRVVLIGRNLQRPHPGQSVELRRSTHAATGRKSKNGHEIFELVKGLK